MRVCRDQSLAQALRHLVDEGTLVPTIHEVGVEREDRTGRQCQGAHICLSGVVNVHLDLGQGHRSCSTHPVDGVRDVIFVVGRVEIFAVPAFGEANQTDQILVTGTGRWGSGGVLDVVATIP